MGIKKDHSKINLNNSMMKALRAVNSLSGKSADDADLKSHRKTLERSGRLAAPKGNVTIKRFKVGNIPCELIKPDFAHNPQYAIIYAYGGGYISGGLYFARILAAKMAIATGFTTFSFDYRLAPENPYPAALDDGMAIWDFLTKGKYAPDHVLLAIQDRPQVQVRIRRGSCLIYDRFCLQYTYLCGFGSVTSHALFLIHAVNQEPSP